MIIQVQLKPLLNPNPSRCCPDFWSFVCLFFKLKGGDGLQKPPGSIGPETLLLEVASFYKFDLGSETVTKELLVNITIDKLNTAYRQCTSTGDISISRLVMLSHGLKLLEIRTQMENFI